MSESFIQVPPDSTGKQIDMWTVTASSGPLYRQGVVVADPTSASSVQAVKPGGILSSASVDGAAVVTLRDPVVVANPTTVPPIGSGAFNAGATVVTGVAGAATQIVLSRSGAPGVGRVALILTNNGSETVTIGNNVSMTSGYPLAPGATLRLETQAEVDGFVDTGGASVGFIETF